MALLSVLLPLQSQIDLETYSILRDSSSNKLKYPIFIATLALEYPSLIPYFTRESGFINTYKRMITAPTSEELSIRSILMDNLKHFPFDIQASMRPTIKTFVWPVMTEEKWNKEIALIKEELKSSLAVNYPQEHKISQHTLTNKDFMLECIKLSPILSHWTKEAIYERFIRLPNVQQENILEIWACTDDKFFYNLGDYIQAKIYSPK